MLTIITLRSIQVLSTKYKVLGHILVTFTENLEKILIRLVFYIMKYIRCERKLRVYNKITRK